MRGNGHDCHGHHGDDEFGELWRLFTLPIRVAWKMVKTAMVCLVWFVIILLVITYIGSKSKSETPAERPAEQLICK